MPEGTKVDKLYKKLRAEGKSEESAARIAQSVTGEALTTGKPPKGKETSLNFKPGDKVHIGFGTKGGAGFNGVLVKIEDGMAYVKNDEGRTFKGQVSKLSFQNSNIKDQNDNNFDEGKRWAESGSTAFQNGRMKAEQAIKNRVQNAIREMSKTEILKRAREGRWELQQDLDRKRNGDHVEVRMPNGNSQQIRIEGD